jgi:alanyl-tRNA synthetase
MQQHSGQHLLSAAFMHLLNAPTIGFHLGTETSHIDLNTPGLSWDEAFRVEADVNRVIGENRPVDIHFVDEKEIHTVPLRRPPKVGGTIRVVWVKDYDAAACGGTHVKQTGAVGLLKITHVERYKGGMRVSFRCGQRALEDYQRVLRVLQEVSADLSVHQDQLGEAVGRLKGELRESRQSLRAAQGKLMAFEAERLLAESPQIDGVCCVVSHLQNCSYDDARAIASHVCGHPHTLALLAVTEAKGIRMICQRSDELVDLNAADILSRAAETLGGRSGGTPDLAQGGAPSHPHETVQEALHNALSC